MRNLLIKTLFVDSGTFFAPIDQWAFSKLKGSLHLKGRVVTRCSIAGHLPLQSRSVLPDTPPSHHLLIVVWRPLLLWDSSSWKPKFHPNSAGPGSTWRCAMACCGALCHGALHRLLLSVYFYPKVIPVVLPSPVLPPSQWEGISSQYFLGFWMPETALLTSHSLDHKSSYNLVHVRAQWMQGNNEWLKSAGRPES